MTRIRILMLMLWGTLFPGGLVGEQAQTLASTPWSVAPAVDGIFVAFQTHSIVGMADLHGLAQEEDFYVDLIRDPRFIEEIDNVVVEFGGAAQQDTIDRYVAGEDIPYEQLRRVSWLAIWPNYGLFFSRLHNLVIFQWRIYNED